MTKIHSFQIKRVMSACIYTGLKCPLGNITTEILLYRHLVSFVGKYKLLRL